MSDDESGNASEQETSDEDESAETFADLGLEEVTVGLEGLGSLVSPVDGEDGGNEEDA